MGQSFSLVHLPMSNCVVEKHNEGQMSTIWSGGSCGTLDLSVVIQSLNKMAEKQYGLICDTQSPVQDLLTLHCLVSLCSLKVLH